MGEVKTVKNLHESFFQDSDFDGEQKWLRWESEFPGHLETTDPHAADAAGRRHLPSGVL